MDNVNKTIQLLLLSVLILSGTVSAQVLRNLVHIEGVRENQLIGYGLVVGLNNTGDGAQVKFSGQSVANMLKQFGVNVPERPNPRVRNVATVMVSATFPPGYRKGQSIDVTVSSMGDAKSLRGGTLLLTPLRGVDNEVYALAQGNLLISGVEARGRSGSSITINTLTSGRIPNGATIEREIPTDFDTHPTVRLSLRHPHFQTATNIVNAINRRFGHDTASTRDATTVEVQAPTHPTQRVAFVAQLESMDIHVGHSIPKVVFNSRTGTVVVGEGVTVRAAAVSHGPLKVVISEKLEVSQPHPFGRGSTAVVPQSKIEVNQNLSPPMFKWPSGTDLQTMIDTINSTGASPSDVMAILQALDQAGAIDGELVVI